MFVVVKTHSFDPEKSACSFDYFETAKEYLRWIWEDYYNEQIANGIDMDEYGCFIEDDYARIQWADGDYTEFCIIEVTGPLPGFYKNR